MIQTKQLHVSCMKHEHDQKHVYTFLSSFILPWCFNHEQIMQKWKSIIIISCVKIFVGPCSIRQIYVYNSHGF